MEFDIITIFPHIFDSYLSVGVLNRARQLKRTINIRTHDLRAVATDAHKTIDDRPYGGGAGMVLMGLPIIKTITRIKNQNQKRKHPAKTRVVLFSAKGKIYTQEDARRLCGYERLILICGRYEGIDERVLNFVDEEFSIGEYVLTGGELPALVCLDSIARLIPGVLGCEQSNQDESFSIEHVREYPHFTRPERLVLTAQQKKYVVRKKTQLIPWRVPDILLSGNHRSIEQWRDKHRDSNKNEKG